MALLSIYLIPIALFDHLEWQATGLEFIVYNVSLRSADILELLTERFILHRAVILK